MKGVGIVTVLLFVLMGCSVAGEHNSLADRLDQLVERETQKEHCMGIFEARIKNVLAGRTLTGDRDAVLLEILDALPEIELRIFTKVANEASYIDRSLPDAEVVPAIVSSLAQEFERSNICGIEDARFDVYLFADQLNVYLIRMGLDTNLLFPSKGDWEADQVSSRMLVALIAKIQDQERSGVAPP